MVPPESELPLAMPLREPAAAATTSAPVAIAARTCYRRRPMATTKIKAGSTVDGWCTKCKLVLAHTVEAMVGAKITRVHCNTCGGQHAYRAAAPGAGKSTKARRSTPRKTAEAAQKHNEYEVLLRGRTGDKARPYATSERFAPGELIKHSAFGLGVVIAERDSVKIDVAFPDGPKVLLHGR
ncbi:MAG: hypothetical protein B6D46_09050 [Polyangiaceae bacterium UTPRO1]|nr:hypothetical protein [Myxococcales bacterium]OQY66871.1 MAG: hypothetical protein B6D46_09050 [Polyangiaceae bacterium UTPRO1]